MKNIKFSSEKQSKSSIQFSSLILRDLKQSGKERPWRKNRVLSHAISGAYFSSLGDHELKKYGMLIASCCSYLKFGACVHEEHGKKLIGASFCKARLCPTCQGRKALVIRKQVLDLVHWHLEKHSSDIPLLLTLTVVNVPGSELGRTIDNMNQAWQRLMRRKVVKRGVRSWFRSLEITYNRERQDFHPHFHVLLMVPKNYFDKRDNLYISQQEWLKLWKASARDDRITQVDIRKIKSKEGQLESMVAEVAKYATKPSDYVEENSDGLLEASPLVIKDLHYALKSRRLIGFGGLFRDLREEEKVPDVEEADLVYIDEDGVVVKECVCKICGGTLLEETYYWDEGLSDYIRSGDPPDVNRLVKNYKNHWPQN